LAEWFIAQGLGGISPTFALQADFQLRGFIFGLSATRKSEKGLKMPL
jgi:hypothetical protein